MHSLLLRDASSGVLRSTWLVQLVAVQAAEHLTGYRLQRRWALRGFTVNGEQPDKPDNTRNYCTLTCLTKSYRSYPRSLTPPLQRAVALHVGALGQEKRIEPEDSRPPKTMIYSTNCLSARDTHASIVGLIDVSW